MGELTVQGERLGVFNQREQRNTNGVEAPLGIAHEVRSEEAGLSAVVSRLNRGLWARYSASTRKWARR